VVNDYLIGLSPTVIARTLSTEGVPAPRTDRWHATTVRNMLDSDRLHQRRQDHAETQQVTGFWERLLTPDDSALVQVSLLMPQRDAARSSSSLLGGILRCQQCDRRMVAGVTSNGKRIYRCLNATPRCHSPRLAADRLDAEAEAAALTELATVTRPNPPCPRSLLERVRNARAQLAALATSFGSGGLDHAEFLTRRRQFAGDLDKAGRDLTLHNRARILRLHPAELRRRWASLSFRRAAICALLSFDQSAVKSSASR